MTQNRSRIGKRWTVTECLQLQREFELLNLSLSEIARRHKRTPNAIKYKLVQEGLLSVPPEVDSASLNEIISMSNNDVSVLDEEEDYEEEDDDEDFVPDGEEADDVYESDDVYEEEEDLKTHILRVEKQVIALTELLTMNKKNKSVFSLFA